MSTQHDLKNAGLKATLPRLKIINLFEQSKVRHLTAEDVYRQLLADGLDVGLAEAIQQASAEVARGDLDAGLVDEWRLMVFPVVLGSGLRLFPEQGQTHRLELVESRTTPSGVMGRAFPPSTSWIQTRRP